MPKFQYVGDGHTLVTTSKETAEKTKVVHGEIVEIDEGLHSDGRLQLAGFRKVAGIVTEAAADVVETAVTAAAEIAQTVSEAAAEVADVLDGEDPANDLPGAEPATETVSAGETEENAAVEAPEIPAEETAQTEKKPSKSEKKAGK